MTEGHGPVKGQSTLAGCLMRFLWMGVGNAALFLLAVLITQTAGFTTTLYDAAFWLVPALVVGARYVDVTRFGGETVDGDPATLAHWRKHALGFLAASLSLWLLAHGLAASGWLR